MSSRSLRFETLEDRRLMAVGVSSLESSVAEGAASLAAFRVSTSETSAEPIELWLNASGAATNDVDYELYTHDAAGDGVKGFVDGPVVWPLFFRDGLGDADESTPPAVLRGGRLGGDEL